MSGQVGFAFEELIGKTLSSLFPAFQAKGYGCRLLDEQNIRDAFNEQSLNGVDHLFELTDASGHVTLFVLQEKWKVVTNQREVSQFLDCCARILTRIPVEKRGTVYRLWVTRSQPSSNGDKSLLEGGAYTIQCMTSPTFLAQNTAQMICELMGDRELVIPTIRSMPSCLPTESPLAPEILDSSKLTTSPVFNYKTKVLVQKGPINS
jgi:hypothetical protein